MSFITSAITSLLVGAAVTSIPALFSRKSKRENARAKSAGEKYIEYSSFVFWMLYAGGAGFLILGILVYLFSSEPVAGIIFISLGLVFLIPTSILQFLDTTVNWTSNYICGAKSGWRLKKNRIQWKDVKWVKLHPNQTIHLEDKFGKSVFWSVYHNGWYEIIEDLRKIRPDIDTSDFE